MKTRKVKLTNSFHSGFTFFSFYEYNFVTLIFFRRFFVLLRCLHDETMQKKY